MGGGESAIRPQAAVTLIFIISSASLIFASGLWLKILYSQAISDFDAWLIAKIPTLISILLVISAGTGISALYLNRRSKRLNDAVRKYLEVQNDAQRRYNSPSINDIQSAILKPVIGKSSGLESGWFGGKPKLPTDAKWPEVEGEPLRFLCQINLSAIPKEVWGGLGPRTGWLCVFLHPTLTHGAALHVVEPIEERAGHPQKDASWYWNGYGRKQPPVSAYSPRWAFEIIPNIGELPDEFRFKKGHVKGFTHPLKGETLDLNNPSLHPFNSETLEELLRILEEAFGYATSTIEKAQASRLNEYDQTELSADLEFNDDTRKQFDIISLELRRSIEGSNKARINEAMARLSALELVTLRCTNRNTDGFAAVSRSRIRLAKCLQDWAWRLNSYGMKCVESNVPIPEPQLSRFKKNWSFDAHHEGAVMGHTPQGHTYLPFGPTSQNEVLIDLPTSDLMCWMWGDAYRIIFLIDREDLANARFDRLQVDVLN